MRDRNKPPARGAYILPNLFTSASLFAGFFSLVLALQSHFDAAAFAIFFSAVMDGLDGKVARLTGTASEFGVQFDSLADVVAFGVAPAFLAWSWQLHSFGRLGLAVSFLFLVCAALRLARFNVSVGHISKRFFIGLPSPAGGCTFAGFVIFADYLPAGAHMFVAGTALVLCFFVPLLLVSRVRYFSFKEVTFMKVHPYRVFVGIITLCIVVFSFPRLTIFLFCLLYILSGLAYSFILLPRRNKQILRNLAQPE